MLSQGHLTYFPGVILSKQNVFTAVSTEAAVATDSCLDKKGYLCEKFPATPRDSPGLLFPMKLLSRVLQKVEEPRL